MSKTTTLEIEVAIMGYFGVRQNLIVPNASWGAASGLHECDLISLSVAGYATEIEIKVSVSDLKKDKEKRHGHQHNHIRYLFFAVPLKMKDKALAEIPERAGLYTVEKKWYQNLLCPKGKWVYYVRIEKGCEPNKSAVKWTEAERFNLARLGTMRIHGLKKKLMNKIVNNSSD